MAWIKPTRNPHIPNITNPNCFVQILVVGLILMAGCARMSTAIDNSPSDLPGEPDREIQAPGYLTHPTPSTPPPDPVRILSLGDSYTIGESVAEAERWPVQLAALLRQNGLPAEEPVIVARTGWTTGDLIANIEAASLQGQFDLVTLLIGVNNQYRGYSLAEYRSQFRQLLNTATTYAGDDPARVIVLSIPDWGATPFAENRNRAQIRAEINRLNAINRQEADAIGCAYVDITPMSYQAMQNLDLIASDGLHPSGEMYSAWAELVTPLALSVLADKRGP